MTTRSSLLVSALVLATLALPSAAALGEEVYEVAREVESLAEPLLALSPVEVSIGDETPQEEAARERQERQHAAPADEPAPEEQPPRQAPPSERSAEPALLRPVSRLLPIPITDVGAAPRVDLGALASSVVPFSPLAPEPRGDAGAPMRAPPAVAPASAAPAAAAPEAEPVAPAALALGATAAATAAAPAAAGALWDRLRRALTVTGPAALLYSRIAKERLLDHASRERLLDAIRARPGLAVADLAEATGAPRNTVTYHLRVLEREGLVSSTRNGRNRLFFAPGALPQRANADALATLRHETTLAIARAIGETPGVDQKAICARVGLSPSLAHWHADRLVASGLVEKRREGRFVRYYPGASFSLVDARAA